MGRRQLKMCDLTLKLGSGMVKLTAFDTRTRLREALRGVRRQGQAMI
jgi:hypothetical protein